LYVKQSIISPKWYKLTYIKREIQERQSPAAKYEIPLTYAAFESVNSVKESMINPEGNWKSCVASNFLTYQWRDGEIVHAREFGNGYSPARTESTIINVNKLKCIYTIYLGLIFEYIQPQIFISFVTGLLI
jgi:hypothetical protein